MNKLYEANRYVTEHSVSREELPTFHVALLIGWMNDPNGFSVYNGKIHLFYQCHPYSKVWGPMHWAHTVTEDFIKWKNMPVALAPDQEYDEAGCFSGTGLDTENGHLLVYTGVMEKEENGLKKTYQNQCVAIGDGTDYRKADNNPVITGDMMPTGFSREDFRDPKIWREEDGYYLLAGNKTDEGIPQVVLFHSDNLEDWQYVSVLAKDLDGKLGTMWECPDFFSLNGEYGLLISPQNMMAGNEFHNGNNVAFLSGKYDKKRHIFQYDKAISVDEGLDFYAPQTLEMPDGRRIMIGWMQSWDSNIRPENQKWSGMMSLPRELQIIDGKLIQSPVKEMENYYADTVNYTNQEIAGECQLSRIGGRTVDMTIEILSGEFREFCIQFAANEKYRTFITYDKIKNTLEFDRTYSGMVRDTISSRRVAIKAPKESLKLRFVLDKYSAEIFVNDGEQVLSSTFYTPMDAEEIHFGCDGVAVTNIEKHAIAVD